MATAILVISNQICTYLLIFHTLPVNFWEKVYTCIIVVLNKVLLLSISVDFQKSLESFAYWDDESSINMI